MDLRFECQPGCIGCCDQQGFVYLTEGDLKRAAKFVGLTAAEFEKRYVYRTRTLLRLRKPRGSQCHFLLESGCSIHPAKPTQCRTFPFWPELVESRKAWKATARYCPGIGTGQLIQIGTALEIAEEQRQAYPSMYSASPSARR
jgi:uncharacterized protein